MISSPTASPVLDFGVPNQAPVARKKRGPKRMAKVEDTFRDLIRAGIVKIVRQRGRAPRIVWL